MQIDLTKYQQILAWWCWVLINKSAKIYFVDVKTEKHSTLNKFLMAS